MILVLFTSFLTVWGAEPVFAQSLTDDCPEGMLYSRSLSGQVECLPMKRSAQSEPRPSGSAAPMVDAVGRMGATQPAADHPDFAKGFWDHRSYGKAKGQFCTASFFKEGSSVVIVGPGGTQPGALMIFAGPAVPQPKEPSVQTKVTLKQSDSPSPQTVTVFHVRNPHVKDGGAIVFGVPTIEAAMEGMEDKLGFEVVMQNKPVVSIDWYDGVQARQKLQQCMKSIR